MSTLTIRLVATKHGSHNLMPPGIYRRYPRESHAGATERALTLEDLRKADQLYICNAVRGLRKATLHLDGTFAFNMLG